MAKYLTLKEDLLLRLSYCNCDNEQHQQIEVFLSTMTYDKNHRFPGPDEILRISLQLEFNFIQILALVLKSLWEAQYAQKCQAADLHENAKLTDLYEAVYGKHQIFEFKPDIKGLYNYLKDYHRDIIESELENYSFEDLIVLVNQMIASGLHQVANNSPELQHFIKAEAERANLLNCSEEKEKQTFWELRCLWLETQNDLDEVYFLVEKRRLDNAETERAYLAIYGKEELELKEAIYRHWELNTRLSQKLIDPLLTIEMLDEIMLEMENKHCAEMKRMRLRTITPAIRDFEFADGNKVDYDDILKYRQQAKQLLRQLKKKIHTDHLQHDPAYQKLTDGQKKQLEQMLHEVLEIQPSELGYPEHCLERNMRSLEGIAAAIERVDTILSLAGIDTRIEMVIQGKDLASQIAWLRKACSENELEKETAELELHKLNMVPDVERYQAALNCPEQQDVIKKELLEEAKRINSEADEIEIELGRLFEIKDGIVK
jgi:hypothetical protein